MVNSLDEALRILKNAVRKKENISVGLVGNCADIIPELAERGVRARHPDRPDLGARSAERLRAQRHVAREAHGAAQARSQGVSSSGRSIPWRATSKACCRLQKMGAVTFDYGNNIRTFAFEHGVKNAYDFPGFVPAYIRPLFCEGRGPFRWAALSGDPADIHVTDELVLEMFPENRILSRWIDLARKRIKFQGLPARICWLGYGERAEFGLAMNDMVKSGKLKAPIVMGRDHLDCGSVASPFRETEVDEGRQRRHRRLAAAERAAEHRERRVLGVDPQRRRRGHRIFAARRTSHRRGRNGAMAKRIERVLTNDPGIGVARHVDAGYDEAESFAGAKMLKIPMKS